VTRALQRFAFSLQKEVLEAGQQGISLLRATAISGVCTLLVFMEAAPSNSPPELAPSLRRVEVLASRLGHTSPKQYTAP